MNASDAIEAKQRGIRNTATARIEKISANWEKALETGRDRMWVECLDKDVDEVCQIVVKHFRDLGYSFQKEVSHSYYCDTLQYRIRLFPEPDEPGIFSQLISRIFGGAKESRCSRT